MAYSTRPTIRSSLLGRKLKLARQSAGLTVEEVAQKMGTSPASIYRQESGHTAVKIAAVAYFAKLYEVADEAERARWEEWARNSKKHGWWSDYGTAVGPTPVDYADAEDMATELRTWEPQVVPGLLQTKEYSEVIIQAVSEAHPGGLPMDGLAAVREQRKKILYREEPPRVWAVIGEAALLTLSGGREVMRAQWTHLLDLSERAHVTLQILPFDSGAHPGVGGSFVLMSFGEDDIMFRESSTTGVFNDDSAEVAVTRTMYGLLQAQALSTQASQAYLRGLLAK